MDLGEEVIALVVLEGKRAFGENSLTIEWNGY